MKLRIILLPLIAFVTALILFTQSPNTAEESGDRKKLIAQIVKSALVKYHFSKKPLDDTLSAKAFDIYLKHIDFGKRFLLKEDVDALSRFRTLIDDELKSGEMKLMGEVNAVLQKRVREVEALTSPLFLEPFTFDAADSLEIDPKKRDFPESADARLELWKKIIKMSILDRILAMEQSMKEDEEMTPEEKQQQDKKRLKKKPAPKDITEREAAAREETRMAFTSLFRHLNERDNQDELRDYLNAVALAFDPHTAYMPPRDEANFNIAMGGSLEGIGAMLQETGDYVKVVEIIPGGAAWREGHLEPGDQILKVGQGAEPAIDVVGMRLEKAVQMIRGPKGSEVRLTVKKEDGGIEEIAIIRETVVVEAAYVKLGVIRHEELGLTIGYIQLPSFYRDFAAGEGGRNCADDVANCLEVLKGYPVDALIVDVRNNGGGSLHDVVTICGFFIPSGPVVQVKSLDKDRLILRDEDETQLYHGPLAILTNTASASASEILAGALQDYGRAVIVGSSSTHGKGTVQTLVPLGSLIGNEGEDARLGSLKLTIQKFYRINGSSTQVKGVIPDIIIPDPLDAAEMGERELDHAIVWSEIEAADPQMKSPAPLPDTLRRASEERVKEDPRFVKILDFIAIARERKEKTMLSLLLEGRRSEQDEYQKKVKGLKNGPKNEAIHFTYFNGNAGFPSKTVANDRPELAEELARQQEKIKTALLGDPQVEETIHILKDLKTATPAVSEKRAEAPAAK